MIKILEKNKKKDLSSLTGQKFKDDFSCSKEG